MGILDDAIREHIDLKRKHGARDSEISEIEDEALGSGERPDPFAAGELFGGVSSAGSSAPEAPEQEMGPTTPPPDGPPTPPPDGVAEPAGPEEPTALVEPPAAPPEPPPATPPEPSASGPPAESESLEDLMAEEDASAPPERSDVAVPPPPPPETEPSRPEPPTPPPPAATEGQRGRARGRGEVPTQEHIAPREETGDAAPVPSEPGPPGEGGPQLYDFETDPDLLENEGADLSAPPAPPEESDDFEALGPVDEAEEAEDLHSDEEDPYGEQRGGTTDFEEVEAVEEDYETDVRPAAPAQEEERYRTEVRPADPVEDGDDDEDDLLSESPEFLDKDTDEESLWFEKGPPKDFDFEDEDEDER
jgi:hypothetical protein